MMEDQVPSSKQYVTPGQMPEENNYFSDPNGPRYQNPAEFTAAQEQTQVPVPDFQEMRRIALEQAIQQVTQQQQATQQAPPPGMELSMDGSQYVPQKYPVAPAPAPKITVQPTEQVRVVRRNLTLAELILIFAIATGSVLGVQGIWSFATDILPRIEIRAK